MTKVFWTNVYFVTDWICLIAIPLNFLSLWLKSR